MSSSVGLLDDAARRMDAQFRTMSPVARLRRLREEIAGRIVFTTSFGLEDQALTELVAEAGVDIDFATLDTGRLFPETYGVWTATEARYNLRVKAVYPDRQAIEALVADQGIDGFYYSPDMRKACCGVRKVEPLRRALAGAEAWITGLRADQSDERHDLRFAALDPTRGLVKVNPLLDWSREETAAFAKQRGVPLNPLHDAGFLSIGCAPCTRAVRPGENERAGRWWWEQENSKECGLHVDATGTLSRARPTPEPAGERA
jgi:phosphoadenosine phosphosulfate reductase